MKVGILGLGLIGGSLARDLAANGVAVIGHDANGATVRAARRAKVLAGAAGPDFDGFESCDVCVIAVPVADAQRALARLAPLLANVPLVTDVGSTKGSIVSAAVRAGLGDRFVGAHPFAGDHRSGWEASRRGLFVGARVLLSPTRRTSPVAWRRARAFWRGVGARPEEMGAAEHDRFMAAASHLPQLFAATLAGELRAAGVPRESLGRGGLDATRLAGSNPDVWAPIVLDNAIHIVPLLRGAGRRFDALARAVERGDRRAIRRVLSGANRWFVG